MRTCSIDHISTFDARPHLPSGAGSDAMRTDPEYCLAVTHLGSLGGRLCGTGFEPSVQPVSARQEQDLGCLLTGQIGHILGDLDGYMVDGCLRALRRRRCVSWPVWVFDWMGIIPDLHDHDDNSRILTAERKSASRKAMTLLGTAMAGPSFAAMLLATDSR
jgi:hypothetical protein